MSAFGTSIAIDGDRLYVGAPTDGQVGKVYVYDRDRKGTPTPTDDVWVETQVITPPTSFIDMGFGASLDVEGSDLVVGSPRWLKVSGPAAIPVGAVFLYEEQGGSFAFQAPSLKGSQSSNERLRDFRRHLRRPTPRRRAECPVGPADHPRCRLRIRP